MIARATPRDMTCIGCIYLRMRFRSITPRYVCDKHKQAAIKRCDYYASRRS